MRTKIMGFVIAVALTGCHHYPKTTDGGLDDDLDGGVWWEYDFATGPDLAEPGPCTAPRFKPNPTSFPLPDGYAPAGFRAGPDTEPGCTASLNHPRYSLLDMNGDGKLDVVVRESCDPTSAVGTSHWLVYPNDGTRFAAMPTQFGLPSGYTAGAFRREQRYAECDSFDNQYRRPGFFVRDMNGDGKPDLVIYDGCDPSGDDSSTIGTTEWRVHLGDGTKFAATATSFTLPSGYASQAFVSPPGTSSGTCTGSTDRPAYRLVDLTGDGKLDLVVTDACAAAVGNKHWLLYASDGTKFAATATQFALPAGYSSQAFTQDNPSPVCSTNLNQPSFFLDDLDGDGKSDLVVYHDCNEPGPVGSTAWLLFKSDGTKFAPTATSYALPGGFPAGAFRAPENPEGKCPTSTRPGPVPFVFLDWNLDHRRDLVVLDDCAPPGTTARSWSVSLNDGTKLGPVTKLPTPPSFGTDAFRNYRADAADCGGSFSSGAAPAFFAADLDGNGKSELVVMDDCNAAGPTGGTSWALYPTECD